MSQPVAARLDLAGNRLYTWTGRGVVEEFYSVTTIINGGVPKYLHRWAAKAVAELVLNDLHVRGPHARSHAALRRWAKSGRLYVAEQQSAGELRSIKADKLSELDFIARWLKGAPDRIRDAAAARGSAVHQTAEELVLEQARAASRLVLDGAALPVWPTQIAAWMESFVGWVNEWRPVFVAAEATVYSRSQAYAGTLDSIIELDRAELLARLDRIPEWLDVASLPERVSVLVDYKAGNDIYREVALQLSGYRAGEFIGSPDRVTELALPRIDVGAVLHLTPKKPLFRLVRIDDVVLRSFLYSREVFRWAIETSRDVLGPVLLLPAEAVA